MCIVLLLIELNVCWLHIVCEGVCELHKYLGMEACVGTFSELKIRVLFRFLHKVMLYCFMRNTLLMQF